MKYCYNYVFVRDLPGDFALCEIQIESEVFDYEANLANFRTAIGKWLAQHPLGQRAWKASEQTFNIGDLGTWAYGDSGLEPFMAEWGIKYTIVQQWVNNVTLPFDQIIKPARRQ